MFDHRAREDEIDRKIKRLSRVGVDGFVPRASSLHVVRTGYRTKDASAIFFTL